MKNLMVANYQEKSRYTKEHLELLLQAQIDNSLELGWNSNDIIILSNFFFDFMGVRPVVVTLNDSCLTGSKCFACKWVYENTDYDVIWGHDLDAWQNSPFTCPDFLDVGLASYSRPKFNGGSIFWRRTGKDILDDITDMIINTGQKIEEPTLNTLLRNKYKDRVTELDNTFNVGCSGFLKRYLRSNLPIRVCHFHPTNRIAWETHVLDRSGVGVKSVSERLEGLIRKYFPGLPTKLKGDINEKKQTRLREIMRTMQKGNTTPCCDTAR